MKNIEKIKERYTRDSLPVRLGGLAANLARIKSFSDNSGHGEAVKSLVEESKYFIEWTTSELIKPDLQEKLAEIQLQLALWEINWQNIWNDTEQKKVIAEQTKIWSDWILEISGLLR